LLVTPSASARVRSFEPRAPIIEVSFKPDERSVQQLATLIGSGSWRDQEVSSNPDVLGVIQVEQPAGPAGKPRGAGRRRPLASVAGR
jgi:hypothetical protein